MPQRQPGRVRTQFLLSSLAVAALALGWTAFARRDEPPPGREAGGWRQWQGAGDDAPARQTEVDKRKPPTPNQEPQTGSDFPRKPPPQPGEWLARFNEPGQTVDEYKEECRNRRREGRETIVIQPLGGIMKNHADVIERTREYVALYYGCPAEVAEPLPMPEDAFVKRRDQYDAGRILVDLGNRVPPPSARVRRLLCGGPVRWRPELRLRRGRPAPPRRRLFAGAVRRCHRSRQR